MEVFSRIEEVGLVWQESKVRMLAKQVLAKQSKASRRNEGLAPNVSGTLASLGKLAQES